MAFGTVCAHDRDGPFETPSISIRLMSDPRPSGDKRGNESSLRLFAPLDLNIVAD